MTVGKDGYTGTRFLDGPVGRAGIAGSGLEVPGLAAWQGAPRNKLVPDCSAGVSSCAPQEVCLPLQQGTLASENVSSLQDGRCWMRRGDFPGTSRPWRVSKPPKGLRFLSTEEPGSLTQEERVPLAEALGCSGGHSHLHCHPRHALLTRPFWTQLPTSTQLVVPKQTGPAHLARSPALLWACGNKGSQLPLPKPTRALAFSELSGRPCPGAPSLPAAGPCSPGARIPMQVQDDRVAGRQGILVPHLVLPLGILPPDSRDRVPGSSSRGEQQVTRPQAGCLWLGTAEQRAGGWGGRPHAVRAPSGS